VHDDLSTIGKRTASASAIPRRRAAQHERQSANTTPPNSLDLSSNRHVREALARYDIGEIDAFDLDELIHQYKRAMQGLWKFCVGGGSHVLFAARTLTFWEAEGEQPDWWQAGAPRRRR
jgi:hypothetical protein